MRLTLRTLLAYLDDTLEPAQAKLIGQKVAESDTAQELIARIRQVTRRRRLTILPATGPGSKLDPNTVAEYLDNALPADQTAEVEQICLASDVHLADIAASHQILTLVLGEPVLIPPSSRQRMYTLVRGREAIPFRRPPARSHAEPGPEAGHDLEADETLRLGLPAYRGGGSWSSRLTVIGGGLLIALLLGVAMWGALRTPHRNGSANTALGPTVAEGSAREGTAPAKGNGDGGAKLVKEEKKSHVSPETKKEPVPTPGSVNKKEGSSASEDKQPNLKKNEPGPGPTDKKVEKPEVPVKRPVPAADHLVGPPSNKEVPVGKFVPVDAHGLLLQRETPQGGWHVLDPRSPAVFTGRPLVSLPGCPAVVELPSGLRLTLWGALTEQLLPPAKLELWGNLRESRVVLHHDPSLAADLTVQRGRIILANGKKTGLSVRVRADNTMDPALPQVCDVKLEEPGTEVLVDVWHYFPLGEPFFKNPKDSKRIGPLTAMHVIVRKGAVTMTRNDRTWRIDAPPPESPAVLFWNSKDGVDVQYPLTTLAEWMTDRPGLPAKLDPKVRKGLQKGLDSILRARDVLVKDLKGRGDNGDVALATLLKESPKAEERMLVVRCFGALDDVANLVDALGNEDQADVRFAAVDELRFWVAAERDNDYRALAELKGKYQPSEAQDIVLLLHSFSAKEATQPETFQFLLDYLDSPKVAVRELSYWHLVRLANSPEIAAVPYSASARQDLRQRAVKEIQAKLRQAGKLPAGAPPG